MKKIIDFSPKMKEVVLEPSAFACWTDLVILNEPHPCFLRR